MSNSKVARLPRVATNCKGVLARSERLPVRFALRHPGVPASCAPLPFSVLIPLGTDRALRRSTHVNHVLIALNLVAFAAMAVLARTDGATAKRVQELLWLDPEQLTAWGFVTYAFLHANLLHHTDLMHILGNMLFLWVFGPSVEDRLGKIGYAVFYLAGAAAAGALHAAFEQAPVIGASGAVAAVTGMYLVLFPRTHVRTLVFFFIIGVFMIPAVWYIGARIAWDVYLQSSGGSGRVATLAHLGGYGMGIGVGLVLLATGILKREDWDLFSLWKQAARRRQFRDAMHESRSPPSRAPASRASSRPATRAPSRRPDPSKGAIRSEAIASARARVSHAIASLDMPRAAEAYRALLAAFADSPEAAVLSRRSQYDLANFLFQSGDHATAAAAYEAFLRGYPKDAEAPQVKLLLATILARHAGDVERARELLTQAVEQLDDDPDALALAREQLAALPPAPSRES